MQEGNAVWKGQLNGKLGGASMVGGSAVIENSVEISAATTSLGRSEARNAQTPLKALGQTTSGCSSCFGRAISTTKRIPGQESMFSSHGLRYRKSRRCLRKFSCISSCDVLPTVTTSGPTSLDKHVTAHSIKHRGESLGGRNGKSALISSAGSLVHKNLRRGLGGLLREKGSTTNAGPFPGGLRTDSDSIFRTGNWCLRRPTTMKSDTMISSNALSRVNSALQISSSGRSRVDRDASRSSTDSCETSLMSMSNEEALSRRLVGNLEGGSFYERELGALDSGERRNTTSLWISSGLAGSTPRSLGTRDRPNSSSSIFPGASSASRSSRVPFLFGMAHRTRSLEVVSSPSSYMSSPDVHLSNPDMSRSYASTTLQSPYLSRAASSPEYQEGYHLHHSSETPIFRSFRQFPLQPFEEGQECFTYGGISEQQVFMWEANLILGGIPVQDQYRDLRLDIDSMSYEDLLALEESIGNVSTGLEKDTISSCLSSKKYSVNKDFIPTEKVGEFKCSICQVDFEEGNELGALKCGHSHHFQCIEEWLLRKNQCPICKASAFTKTET